MNWLDLIAEKNALLNLPPGVTPSDVSAFKVGEHKGAPVMSGRPGDGPLGSYYTVNENGELEFQYGSKGSPSLFEKAMPFLLPPLATFQRAAQGVIEGDPYTTAHNLFSFSPMIDEGISNVGRETNNLTQGAAGKVVNYLGPLIGGIVGTAYGGPLGAMGGSAAGKMFSGRFNNLSERDIQQGTALAGGTAYATAGLMKGLSSPSLPATDVSLELGVDPISGTIPGEQITSALPNTGSNFVPEGAGTLAPTGATDALETSINATEGQLPVDQIPTGTDISQTATSGMNVTDATPNISAVDTAKQVGNTLLKGYGYANKANSIYNLMKSISGRNANAPLPKLQQQATPAQIIATLGNMKGNENKKAWGSVLV